MLCLQGSEKALLGRKKKKIYVLTEDNANYTLLEFFENNFTSSGRNFYLRGEKYS